MNWAVFVVNMTRALAWPIAAMALAWVLRESLGSLIGRVTRVRVGGSEIELSRKVDEIAQKLPSYQPITKGDLDQLRTYKLLAEISPRAAIAEAWNELEQRIGDLIGATRKPNQSVSELLRELSTEGSLPADIAAAVWQLRDLRNQAVHRTSATITMEDVMSFVALAKRIELAMRRRQA
ncbi:MAG TPA: DUF4145 domain-containing protein [Gammaproteobacteria bacterium]|nr:DUF4145 domain-containing protein [Gammaproteobacteria bacterium]